MDISKEIKDLEDKRMENWSTISVKKAENKEISGKIRKLENALKIVKETLKEKQL